MIIRGRITDDHIARGEPGSQLYCPLNRSLHDKGLRNVVITTQVVKVVSPKDDNEYLGVLPLEIVEWIAMYDRREKVSPIRYRIELE